MEATPVLGMRSFTAGVGAILPSTCVRLSYIADFTVEPAVPGDFPFGICQDWVEQPPGTPFNTAGVAATAGRPIMVWGPGSVAKAAMKRTSDFISPGRPVGPSTASELIVVASGPSVGWLLEGGTVGRHESLRVFVHPHTVTGTEGSGS